MVVRSSRARKRHRHSTADGQHQRFQSTTSEAPSKSATVTSNVQRRGPLLVGKADPTSHHCLQAAAQFPRSRPCLLYTSPSPRDRTRSRMPSSA